MAAGINLTEHVVVYLGEIKEQLLYDLDKAHVKYKIMFDKLNKENVKETILHLRDLTAEVVIKNDIVSYIKSDNNEFTHLDTIEDITTDPLSHIRTIKELIENKFGSEGYTVKIESLDTKTMNITVILTSNEERIRMRILRDTHGEVFINTLIRI